MSENLTSKIVFFLLNWYFSDIIAFIEKHKIIHTLFGMNVLFFQAILWSMHSWVKHPKRNEEKGDRNEEKITSLFAFLISTGSIR